jgi:hypothetical protein
MAMFRARACPKCQYYVGYSVTKPSYRTPEASVQSFCLNCNYRLPVRAVMHGMKNTTLRQKPKKPAGALQRANDFHGTARLTAALPSSDAPARGVNYPRDLRAIGQELEKRGFKTFNLKCSGDAYFVWSTETIAPSGLSGPANTETGAQFCYGNSDNPTLKMLLDRIVGFQFNADEVARLEQEGMKNRGQGHGVSNSSRLSHLLRTVGEQVYRRNQRLLAVAWQELNIGVVAESVGGHCELNVLRSDNIYDLWVRMYLRRSH